MTISWLSDDERFRIIDIGARGDFHDVFTPVMARTEVIGFEPDADEAARLSAGLLSSKWGRAAMMPYAIGRTEQSRSFYLFTMREFSSLLPPNPRLLRGKTSDVERIIQLDTISLDDLSAAGTLPTPVDFIKVDTQGSELEILQNGERSLFSTLMGIETEVEFIEAYQGQPLFRDIDAYLDARDFDLVILNTKHYLSGGLRHTRRLLFAGDAVYLRGARYVQRLDTAQRQAALPKLLAIYALYGLWSAAIDLAQQFDPTLAARIRLEYDALQFNPLRWRLKLLRDFALAWVRGDRLHRVRLARQALQIAPTQSGSWMLSVPNE
ncbi:MAG: FkbM family methyltransferase [Chloroflexota bacterium]|nr:FkbM family methyltransferase [Chloroflexota bacterium]